jgi:hypothetical protein
MIERAALPRGLSSSSTFPSPCSEVFTMDADPASVHAAYERARQMYVERVPIKEICAATGLNDHDLDFALRGGPYVAADVRMYAPIVRNRVIRKTPQRKDRQSPRAALVARLWKSAERQVADIHKRLRRAGLDPDERERDARMLAVMVKTLRELAALDDKAAPHDQRPQPDEPDNRDIDEFRRDLARRIEALVASQSEPADDGAAGA